MKEIDLQLETLSCPSCGAKIEAAVKKVEGVEEAEVLFNSSRVKVVGSMDVADVGYVIEELGYPVLAVDGLPIRREVKKGFFSKLRRR